MRCDFVKSRWSLIFKIIDPAVLDYTGWVLIPTVELSKERKGKRKCEDGS